MNGIDYSTGKIMDEHYGIGAFEYIDIDHDVAGGTEKSRVLFGGLYLSIAASVVITIATTIAVDRCLRLRNRSEDTWNWIEPRFAVTITLLLLGACCVVGLGIVFKRSADRENNMPTSEWIIRNSARVIGKQKRDAQPDRQAP